MKEKFLKTRNPSHLRVCEEQYNWEGKEKKPTEYTPNYNSQQRCSPVAHISHQGLDREAQAACLR